MLRRRASSQAIPSGMQAVFGHRRRQGVFPAVGVLPREYANRPSVRFVRRLFGSVCPRYLREPLLSASLGAAVLAFLALASPLLLELAWIPFAIPSAAAGVFFVFVDESLIPAPTWLSSDDVQRLRRRLYLYRGLSLVFMALGLGGAGESRHGQPTRQQPDGDAVLHAVLGQQLRHDGGDARRRGVRRRPVRRRDQVPRDAGRPAGGVRA